MTTDTNKKDYQTERLGKLYSIIQIFENRRFKVPDYQRGYSWDKEQRDDLLKDIELISEKDYKHFTGTIVAFENNDHYFEIVDGQQRLTTLFILISQFKRILHKSTFNDFFNILLCENPRKLKLNKETDDFFQKCVFYNVNQIGDHKSENNILDAKLEFISWIVENIKNAPVYLETILNKLGFLFYTPHKKSEVSIMFEVINNRGKPLSQLEKVKNYLIYYSTKHSINLRGKIDLFWGELLKNLQIAGKITNDDEDAFLRNCWLVYARPSKKYSYNNYRNLKEKFPIEFKSEKDIEIFFDFLLRCSAYYSTLYSKGRGVHELLRYHPALGSVMPLYLSISYLMENHKIEDNSALELLEKLNFRVYVCPGVTKRSDVGQSLLFNLAHQIFIERIEKPGNTLYAHMNIDNDDWKNSNLLEKIKQYLIAIIKNECKTEEFIKSFTLDIDEEYNYYKWPGLKLLLANYEIHLSRKKKVGRDNISTYLMPKRIDDKSNDPFELEHIWAMKNRDNIKNNYHEKSRLGNFVLLQKALNIAGYNSDLSFFDNIPEYYLIKDRDGKYKLETYLQFEKQLRQIYELKNIHNGAKDFVEKSRKYYDNRFFDYYQKIIDLRETKLISFALERWGIDVKEKKLKYIIDSKIGEKEHETNKDRNKVYFLKME